MYASMRNLVPGLLCCVCLVIPFTTCARAEETVYRGRPIHEVLGELQKDGLALVYSTNLVSNALMVVEEPVSRDPVQLAIEILEPHGLTLNQIDGIYLVVRQDVAPETGVTASLLVIISNIEALRHLQRIDIA